MHFPLRFITKPLFVFSLGFILGHAQAAPAPGGLGIGGIVGYPTGLSAKIWEGQSNAIDLALGWSFGHDINLHGDYVWHNYELLHVEKGRFPVYYGLGGAAYLSNNPGFGIRMVGGLEYLFPDAPLDIFLELAPTAMIFPHATPWLSGGLGMRYFF